MYENQFSWLTYLVIALRLHVRDEIAPAIVYRWCKKKLASHGDVNLNNLLENQIFFQLAKEIESTDFNEGEKKVFQNLGENISEIKEFNEVVINFLSGIPHQRFQFRTWKGRGLPLDGSDTPKLVLDFFLAIANGELSIHDFSRLFKEVIMVKKDERDILTEEHLNALVGVAKDILLFQETPSDAKRKCYQLLTGLFPIFKMNQ